MIPDLNPNTVSWETFGFPDSGFVPASIGYLGLRWAIYERELINKGNKFDNAWDLSGFLSEWPRIGHDPIDKYYFSDINNRIEMLVTYNYLHPDRLDGFLRGTYTVDQAKWTMDELLTAAAGGNASDVLLRPPRFSPEYNLAWLKQRYNAINLLRYATLIRSSSYQRYEWHGGSWNDYFSPVNTLEGLLSFMSGNNDGVRIGDGSMPSLYMLRYNYRGDTRTYTYCWYQQITRIIPVLPTGIDNWIGHLGLNLYVPEGTVNPSVDQTPGHNHIISDADGSFRISQFPFWNGKILSEGQSMDYELVFDYSFENYSYPPIYYDLNPQFRFKPQTEME